MEHGLILEKVKTDNIKLISLQFTDLSGVVKEVIIPAKRIEDALMDGIWFDGSSVEGFARIQESDLFLKPDPKTYAVVPWLQENGKTARMICDIHKPDGAPFEGDPRFILKNAVKEAAELEFNVGAEPEFYLFRKDGPARTMPIDQGGYFDLSSHEGYKVMKEIVSALSQFGIDAEASHHEVGKGQYEMDFRYGLALDVADKLITLKYTVKKIAQMHELHATFIPKPIMGAAGNGLHVHQSLFKSGENTFYDENERYRLSKIARCFIAGQMLHIKAMCAITCPTVNSYKRLVSGFEAPVYITWACMNRSALIRVPQWFKQRPKSARIELRCPDPSCNPYLAFAVMLRAGLDGIRKGLQPPEPIEEDVYKLDSESLINRNIDILPSSLFEALNEMKRDGLIRETLGSHLFDRYIKIKTSEWDEFKTQVTRWELDKYMDIY